MAEIHCGVSCFFGKEWSEAGKKAFVADCIAKVTSAIQDATIHLFVYKGDEELAPDNVRCYAGDKLDTDAVCATLAKEADDSILFLYDASYKNITAEHIRTMLDAFTDTKPSVLLCQDFRGKELGAITILTKAGFTTAGKALHDLGNSYVHMLDKIETQQATSGADSKVDEEREAYSSGEQKALAEQYMDNIGEHYGFAEDELDDPVLKRSSRDVPERIEVLLGTPHGKKILDIGCSAGVVTLMLAKGCDEIVGVDIVEQLIHDANERKAKESEEIQDRVTFVCDDIVNLDFDEEHFDTAYFTEFFEHIPHVKRDDILQQIMHYLTKEGNVVISVPNRYPKEEYVKDKRHRWDWHNHLTHYTKRSLADWAGRHFQHLEFVPMYDEAVEDGIWLICVAKKKNA